MNWGSSGTCTTSLALRNSTPRPLIPGTQSAFRACWAVGPSPDESTRKWLVGEQSSKCQEPNPPDSPPSVAGGGPPSMGGKPTPEPPEVAPPLLVEALVLPSPPMTTTPLGVPTTAFVSGWVYSSYVSALKRESGLEPPQPVDP